MLFLLIGEDSPEAPRLREELLQAHFDWVIGAMERIRVAGPIRDASGRDCASLFLVEADDEAGAREFIAGDPYFRGGVWKSVAFRPFLAAAGTWIGGAARPR